jgi:hypothetical protein
MVHGIGTALTGVVFGNLFPMVIHAISLPLAESGSRWASRKNFALPRLVVEEHG